MNAIPHSVAIALLRLCLLRGRPCRVACADRTRSQRIRFRCIPTGPATTRGGPPASIVAAWSLSSDDRRLRRPVRPRSSAPTARVCSPFPMRHTGFVRDSAYDGNGDLAGVTDGEMASMLESCGRADARQGRRRRRARARTPGDRPARSPSASNAMCASGATIFRAGSTRVPTNVPIGDWVAAAR